MDREHPSEYLRRETAEVHTYARSKGLKVVGEVFFQAEGSIKFVLESETGEREEKWVILPSNANLRGERWSSH